MFDLQGLNHRHRALLHWCIANPHRQLREAAAELNFAPNYVKVIVHSDVFQEAYRQVCAEQGQQAVFAGNEIRSKLNSIAHQAIDEIDRRMEAQELESRELLTAAKLSLTALGYINPKGYSTDMHVAAHIQVDIGIINDARERVLQSAQRIGEIELPKLRPPRPLIPGRTIEGD